MDEDTDQATYLKLESVVDAGNGSNKFVLNNTPLVICSENNVPSHYMPCVENGQIVLRKIQSSSISRLEVTDQMVEVIKVENDQIVQEIKGDSDETVQELNEEVKEPVILNSLISLPKKKLSYETTFVPAVPLTKGVNKGIIRYGSKHLIIDQHIMIPPREFKRQLNNTEDLVTSLELAPCSKQQMHRMLSGFTRMFAYPAHKMPNSKLLQLYNSNCISRKQENVIDIEEMDELPVNSAVPFDFNSMRRLSRKRKCSGSENVLKTKSESKNCVLSEVDTATNSASFDHKYSKQLESSRKLNNTDTKTVKPEQLIISSDSLNESETFMIIDDSGTNISQNNLEILLAAASESTELNQIVTICDEDDIRFNKRIIIVANDKIEQILGS